MNYFRHYWEQPDDSGAAIDDPNPNPDAEVEEIEEVEEAAPETYTREQLAELLPHFDRFATHEGDEAFRQYGSAYENARRLISTGGHMTPQEEEAYRAVGIDPAEIQLPQAEPDPGPSIYGAPWETPTTWDEYIAYAQSDSPEQRRLAAYGVLQSAEADQQTKQWFFNQWAQADPHGAASYTQQATITAAEQRLADLEARMEAKYAATTEDLQNRNAGDLMEAAKANVKGFEEHAAGVLALWNERVAEDPGYADRFLAAPRGKQFTELRRLTVIAAAEAAPERDAANAAAAAETTSAKLRARTETSRTSGAAESDVDESTRQRREAMRRVGARIT